MFRERSSTTSGSLRPLPSTPLLSFCYTRLAIRLLVLVAKTITTGKVPPWMAMHLNSSHSVACLSLLVPSSSFLLPGGYQKLLRFESIAYHITHTKRFTRMRRRLGGWVQCISCANYVPRNYFNRIGLPAPNLCFLVVLHGSLLLASCPQNYILKHVLRTTQVANYGPSCSQLNRFLSASPPWQKNVNPLPSPPCRRTRNRVLAGLWNFVHLHDVTGDCAETATNGP